MDNYGVQKFVNEPLRDEHRHTANKSLDQTLREIMIEIAEMRMAGSLRPFREGEPIGVIPIEHRADLSPRARAAMLASVAIAKKRTRRT